MTTEPCDKMSVEISEPVRERTGLHSTTHCWSELQYAKPLSGAVFEHFMQSQMGTHWPLTMVYPSLQAKSHELSLLHVG
jgi:hypothetical protein